MNLNEWRVLFDGKTDGNDNSADNPDIQIDHIYICTVIILVLAREDGDVISIDIS